MDSIHSPSSPIRIIMFLSRLSFTVLSTIWQEITPRATDARFWFPNRNRFRNDSTSAWNWNSSWNQAFRGSLESESWQRLLESCITVQSPMLVALLHKSHVRMLTIIENGSICITFRQSVSQSVSQLVYFCNLLFKDLPKFYLKFEDFLRILRTGLKFKYFSKGVVTLCVCNWKQWNHHICWQAASWNHNSL